MNTGNWHIKGEWFDVCSCSLPCPCTFAQEPTHGSCLFTLVWHIEEGHFEDERLDGLTVVALGEFSGNMWEENTQSSMRVMFYIDAKGTPSQRDALEEIFRGNVGGWPGTFGSLIGEVREVRYAPIVFEAAADLEYWRAGVADAVKVGARALTGPTADPARRVQLINAPGAEVGPGQVATWGVVTADQAEGFDFSRKYRGGSSKHFPFDWRPAT
ncbi:DUF1326 domain-containing protein [Streptomyces sp. NPDC101490]|uniref:DUF1326 domain-containing protein n=1 Tax=Streptomyces sp. NPDC101490 TaxID=3366143 RepID=UPI003818E722